MTVLSPSVVTRGRWSRTGCGQVPVRPEGQVVSMRSVYLIPRRVSIPQPTIWVILRLAGGVHESWKVAFVANLSRKLVARTLGASTSSGPGLTRPSVPERKSRKPLDVVMMLPYLARHVAVSVDVALNTIN